MTVAVEPVKAAADRIARDGTPVAAIKRPQAKSA